MITTKGQQDAATTEDLAGDEGSVVMSVERHGGKTGPEVTVEEAASTWLDGVIDGHQDPKVRATSPTARSKMVRSAVAIGSVAALQDLQDVYLQWRHVNRLGRASAAAAAVDVNAALRMPAGDVPMASTAPPSAPDVAHASPYQKRCAEFVEAYRDVGKAAFDEALRNMMHRLRLADLHDKCEAAEALAPVSYERGQGALTTARKGLFGEVFPAWAHVKNPASDPRTRGPYKVFSHNLDYAKRWAKLRDRFNAGLLMLIPEAYVNKTYVEQTLSKQLHPVWLDLIEQHNPTAVQLGHVVWGVMSDLIAGGAVQPRSILLGAVERGRLVDYTHQVEKERLFLALSEPAGGETLPDGGERAPADGAAIPGMGDLDLLASAMDHPGLFEGVEADLGSDSFWLL